MGEKVEGITAIYKVNLHCHQCWREIKKPLSRTQGVQNVEVDMEKNEIRVKGSNLDVLKIEKQIEKLSKKRVELISPKVKPKEKDPPKPPHNKPKPTIVHRTITAKVHLHCAKCEQDLKNKLLKHKGIYSVKTDMKAQTLTMEGSIEAEKFKSYLKKKLQKHADITADTKLADSLKPTPPPPEKKKESITDQKEKPKEKPSSETTSDKKTIVAEIQTKDNNNEINNVNNKNNVPYFIHYVYAPQLFSDENPNACKVM
ncbi:heavy metal-associated isoprenylated plant protein 4 [Benincasa hispida]|uniref:heavy metal-associated isoprenylated plant protein 4 n=1 Tax=Benincasa hispida TaxID=102211 RepID=UPI0018FF491D|nr:heavy metal-associated isoprenylated plant protein 4 [Benincasa hispida]